MENDAWKTFLFEIVPIFSLDFRELLRKKISNNPSCQGNVSSMGWVQAIEVVPWARHRVLRNLEMGQFVNVWAALEG